MGKLIFVVLFSIIGAFLLCDDSGALRVDGSCSDVELIFIRGSGQSVEGGESQRYREQIGARVGTERVHFYELGTEAYGGHKYPAVDIGNVFNGNPIGAWVSAGHSNDYGKSVDAGVGELYNYVTQRNAKCPNARIVLGGYSQGAQVIGQTLPKFSETVQSKIDFVALFGDPKLYLPEGEGAFPAACRGLDYSLWRRHIGTCGTDNGALGARKSPYVSQAMASKTGLWCNAADFICGTSKIVGDQAGHGKYKDVGGAIDQAAKEIAVKLKSTLPGGGDIDAESNIVTGRSNPDVVLAISSHRSFEPRVADVIAYIQANAEKIKEQNGRIALIASRDAYSHNSNQAIVVSNFTDNPTDLIESLRNFQYSGGGIMQWSGAHVVRTALRSLALGGVGYYMLGSAQFSNSHTAFSNVLAGKAVGTDYTNYPADLTRMFEIIFGRPQIQAKNNDYSVQSGQEIVFDVSDSIVKNAPAARNASTTEYHWDFDGDRVVDQVTDVPIVRHTFNKQFDGYTIVKVIGSNGSDANFGIPVKIDITPIDVQPEAPTGLDVQVIATKDNVSTLKVSWGAVDSLSKSVAVGVNGTYLGTLDADRLSVEIRDIDRSRVNEVSVAGISQDDVIGHEATKTIEIAPKEPVSGGTTPKPSLLTLLLNAVRFILRGWGFVVSW
ncbi:MAG: cutinase family protein [Chloroflexi bacterium]|nr:MAG: cutinase family protein [Chloroflexota bacterium]